MAGAVRADHPLAGDIRHGPRAGLPLSRATSSRPPLVVAITIGAAPRPDLTDGLRAALGGSATIVEYGALDGLEPADIPAATGAAGRPLVTRRADGHRVVVDEGWLAPRVERLIRRAETEGAVAVVLACASPFAALASGVPLIRPRTAAVARLRELGAHGIAVIVPLADQSSDAVAAWSADGFEPVVLVGEPADLTDRRLVPPPVDAVVLDFVGHDPRAVVAARTAIAPLPLVDLSTEMVGAVVATMGR